MPDGRGALVETPDGKGYVQTVDGRCERCCGSCRTYYRLIACTTETPTICGIIPAVPPPIYLWSGAKCGSTDGPPLVPGRTVVFLAGRCWRVTTLEYNDRNGDCPEPRVPDGATVYDNTVVDCIVDGCEAQICRDAMEGYVQVTPCGICPDAVVYYTCRSYLERCFYVKLPCNPNLPSSPGVCFKFDISNPSVNPSQLPPTAVFLGYQFIFGYQNDSSTPTSCCECDPVLRSGGDIVDDGCDYGVGLNYRQTIGGTTNLGNVPCCCGRAEDWNDAQITISEWVEELVFDTGSTVFLTRLSLDATFTYRNADGAGGLQVPIVQRDYVNGVLVSQQTAFITVGFQGCGNLVVNSAAGEPPAFQLPSDFIELRNACGSSTYRLQFGPPESRLTRRWTITAQYRSPASPCSGGCGGRNIGRFKGGLATNTNTGNGSGIVGSDTDQPFAFGFL